MSDSKFVISPGDKSVDPTEEPRGATAYLLRFFWLVLGKTILIINLIFIAENFHPILMEIIYWVTIAALIAVRYVDITRFNGQTCASRPGSLTVWRRYTIGLLLIGSALFGLALFAEHQRWFW